MNIELSRDKSWDLLDLFHHIQNRLEEKLDEKMAVTFKGYESSAHIAILGHDCIYHIRFSREDL